MKPIKTTTRIKNILYFFASLAGISLIILIHETGHFLFAKLFAVPIPSFSLGFGPALYAFSVGGTTFKIGLLPLGGYVEMNPETLDTLPYYAKMLIVLAGILFNIIFAYGVLFYYAFCNRLPLQKTLKKGAPTYTGPLEKTTQTLSPNVEHKHEQNTLIGPVGIVAMMSKNIATSTQSFWLFLAIISLNVGLFNSIPLPFFDGGKALIYTIEAVLAKKIPTSILQTISTFFLILLIIILTHTTARDIKNLLKK